MKALYIAGICFCSAWALLTVIFLPIYAETEVYNDIYYNADKNQDGTYSNAYTGIEIVIFNCIHVFELLIVIRYLVYTMKNGTEGPNVDLDFLKAIYIFWMFLFFASYACAFIAFIDVCSDNKLKCVAFTTPLYVLLFVKMVLTFLIMGGFILYWIGVGLHYICCPKQPQVEEQRAREQVREPPVQITLETIQQMRQHELQTDCIICSEKLDNNRDIKLLKCSHYFHTACIEKWLLTSDKCPVCKTVV